MYYLALTLSTPFTMKSKLSKNSSVNTFSVVDCNLPSIASQLKSELNPFATIALI